MIYGYSERGIFNSIIYYLDSNQHLIGEFLGKLGVNGFSSETHKFTFLNEQSFSDFGDNDLTIIAEQKQTKEKTVLFIEGKRGKFSLEKEYRSIVNKKFNNSNLFIQLYFKYLLAKGNDSEVIDDSLKEVIKKDNRKIGKNKVVIKARNKYIKDAQYYYIAIIPEQKNNSKTLQEYFKDLNLMTDVKKDTIKCAFWQNIERFFLDKNAESVIENFRYNKGQIY
jgi:hypothetical protein